MDTYDAKTQKVMRMRNIRGVNEGKEEKRDMY